MAQKLGELIDKISIHALREEGDRPAGHPAESPAEFLSTPSARRATRHSSRAPLKPEFLSTPSARRATTCAVCSSKALSHFYPRPPRGGRPRGRHHLQRVAGIFLSTPSARRATQGAEEGSWPLFISIHALREEGDSKRLHWLGFASDFYPRPPRGGRPTTKTWHHRPQKFLSTPSARRATAALWRSAADARDFYPRPPRGGRHVKKAEAVFKRSFLSTPSARRATGGTEAEQMWWAISIHALREEGDLLVCPADLGGHISIHALREEGDF